MSVASEISRLQQAKADLATSITNKGVTVPAATTLDGYAALVDQIQTGGQIPYDAQIEYLESTGTQYINTKYQGNSRTTTFELVTKLTSIDINLSLLGSRVSSSTRFCWVIQPTGTYCQVGYGSGYNNILTSFSINDIIKIYTQISGTTITYYVQNITTGITGSYSYTLSSFNVTDVYLFYSRVLSPAKCKMMSFAFFENGTKTLDYIPVRIGNVGYMYDKISGKFFGNAGAGSFVLGSDKN